MLINQYVELTNGDAILYATSQFHIIFRSRWLNYAYVFFLYLNLNFTDMTKKHKSIVSA